MTQREAKGFLEEKACKKTPRQDKLEYSWNRKKMVVVGGQRERERMEPIKFG